MDSSFTIKPRDSASRVVYDRTSTVRTDLSPAQSVGAPQAVQPLRNGQGPADLTPRARHHRSAKPGCDPAHP